MQHLLSIADLERGDLEALHHLTDRFVEVSKRAIPNVPALRGTTVVSLFFDDPSSTRLSFETAANGLGADVLSFSVSASVEPGESLRERVETISAFGVDAIVVGHPSSGVPHRISRWTDAAVLNGGDGWHQHPTQAVLDSYTIRSHFGSLDGLRIAIVGDVEHSCVARSAVGAFTKLGAEVVLVAPPTLLPPSLEGWPVTVSHDLDAVLGSVGVCFLLPIRHERVAGASLPSLREYAHRFGLSPQRADRLGDRAIIMHPGPVNRGVEISAEVADRPNAVLPAAQAANGVAVRQAALFTLLGSESSFETIDPSPKGTAAP